MVKIDGFHSNFVVGPDGQILLSLIAIVHPATVRSARRHDDFHDEHDSCRSRPDERQNPQQVVVLGAPLGLRLLRDAEIGPDVREAGKNIRRNDALGVSV